MKIRMPERAPLDRSDLSQIANHLFFMTALAFVAHQNILNTPAARAETPLVAQALHLQPRTPPPAFDPDQMSTGEEFDLSVRPERPVLR